MKINSIPSCDMVERYKNKAAPQAKTSDISGVSDRVELSGEAQSFASVFNEVKSNLDVRNQEENDHIAQIAAQIENGTYSVSGSKIADKMLGGSMDIEI